MIPPTLNLVWICDKHPFGEQEYVCLLTALRHTNLSVVLHTDLKPGESLFCPYKLLNLDIRQTVFEKETINGKPVHYIAHAVDWFKINYAYQHGGFWSDLDIFWIQSLRHLADQKAVGVYQSKSYKTAAIGFFGCEPGEPALEKLRKVWYSSKTYWKFANLYKFIEPSNWLLLDPPTLFAWRLKQEEFLSNPKFKVNLKNALGVHLWGFHYRGRIQFSQTPLQPWFQSLVRIGDI